MAKRRLTQQQKERIARIHDRRRQKAAENADSLLNNAENEFRYGRVITRHGSNLMVEDERHQLIHCLFRQNIGHAVCGDRVVWQSAGDNQGVVTTIEKRDSVLVRPNYSGHEKPLAANITKIVIVLAPEPAPQRYLLDQYLITAANLGIDAVICLNKTDLLSSKTMAIFDQDFGDYPGIGYPLIKVSAKQERGLQPLLEQMHHQTAILLGQSGVGKSSLISSLLPDLEIQTGRLSAASGLGCHTTTAATLYHLPSGGDLIDSPGVRSFRPAIKERTDLEKGFVEFSPYLGKCRFSNCKHLQEPDCAIVKAMEQGEIDPRRLNNFRHMAEQWEKGNQW